MEIVNKEDGFNVVKIRCDGCGSVIDQVEQADAEWFSMELEPLARDSWNRGESLGQYHFCSTACFREKVSALDPSNTLKNRSD